LGWGGQTAFVANPLAPQGTFQFPTSRLMDRTIPGLLGIHFSMSVMA